MGFFDRVLGGDDDEDERESREEPDSGSDQFNFAAWTDKDLVDVDQRTDIVFEHYGEVDEEQARVIAEVLNDEMSDGGYSTSSIRDRMEDELDLSDELIETIVRTESASVNLMQTIGTYAARGEGRYVYKIVVPDDDRTHPICSEASELIEKLEGVPLDEMARILQEKAEEYEDQGGTPGRMGHWVPHEKCRHSVVRHV